jgi:hypothetical protein
MKQYNKQLEKALNTEWLEAFWGARKFVFLARFYLYIQTFNMHFRFGNDFNFWLPGLEMKYACEAAEANGIKLGFLGAELNSVTIERCYHETRMNVPHYLMKRYQYYLSPWSDELQANRQKIHTGGKRTFVEKCLDQHLINWYI